MKKISKLFALLLTVAMLILCTSALAQEESPVGYFVGNVVGLECFYHFYEDGTYYAVFFSGGVREYGHWDVKDEGMEYYAEYEEKNGEMVAVESSKAVSEKTIHTVTGDGAELNLPWDNNTLCDFIGGGRSWHMFCTFQKDYTDPSCLENAFPATVLQLYANNKDTRSLTLLHTKTFADFTGDEAYEGTWEETETGYTLTAADGKIITLNKNEDGTYAYTLADNDPVTLTDSVKVAYKFQQKLTGEEEGAYAISAGSGAEAMADAIAGLNGQPAKAVLKCDAQNGTWTLTLSIDAPMLGSPELELLRGTYTEAPDEAAFGYFPVITFTDENGNEYAAVGGDFAPTGTNSAARPYTLPIHLEGVNAVVMDVIPLLVDLDLNLEYTMSITI